MMTRETCTEIILQAKHARGVTFQQIADAVGKDIVWATSATLGQNTFSVEEAQKVAQLLGLDAEIEKALQIFPSKGTQAVMPPTDPLIYRLYEIVLIYGDTIKQVIHEKVGDGIMSAIDFSMHIDKVENSNGDRVKITLDGKFLPYKKW